MNTITLTVGPDRPDYLSQTLDALSRCEGRSEWRLYVIADSPSPAVEDVLADHEDAFDMRVEPRLRGADDPYHRVSINTYDVWNAAFHDGADAILHLEEDILLAPDALRTAAALMFLSDPYLNTDVFAGGLWGVGKRGDPDELTKLPFLYPWGLIVTKERWQEVEPSWDFQHWDRGLQALRGDRLMVYPLISRVQSIGHERGTTAEGMAAHSPTFGVAA